MLPPVVAAFSFEHPAVRVDLNLDDGRIDLLGSGCDLAIRVGNLEDAALITRALAPLELVVCASPDYLIRHGKPVTPADLSQHDCLDFAGSCTPGIWHFRGLEGTVDVAISGPLRANGGFALRAATVAGLGVTMLPKILLQEEFETGRLVLLLESYRPQSRPVQLLTLPDRHPPPKLRCFIDRLVSDLGAGASA